jgi:hypothetical protein
VPSRRYLLFTTRSRLGEEVIAQGVARGQMSDDIPPATIFSILVGPLYVRLLLTDERIDDEFIDAIIETVLDGAAQVMDEDAYDQAAPGPLIIRSLAHPEKDPEFVSLAALDLGLTMILRDREARILEADVCVGDFTGG